MNRRQRRQMIKDYNRERLKVNDGAFGNSKHRRMEIGESHKFTCEQAEAYTKSLQEDIIKADWSTIVTSKYDPLRPKESDG